MTEAEAEAKVKAGEIMQKIQVARQAGMTWPQCEDVLAEELLALLAASRPGEGMIRTHEGKDLRVLGALAMTKDGAVCGNMFCDIWTIHRGTGKVYKTTPYHAGVRGGYSTAEAASAAKGVGDGE